MAMPMAMATATAANSDGEMTAEKSLILYETISAERAFTVQQQRSGAQTEQTKLNGIAVNGLCVCGLCK